MLHQETLNLSVAHDMFLLDCEARRLSPTTRDFYRRKLRIFLKWLAKFVGASTRKQRKRYLAERENPKGY